VEVQVQRLKVEWLKRSHGTPSKNALLKSVFSAFKYEYLAMMALNALTALLLMTSPFFIKDLV
jgi:hypothetical protein